MYCAMTLGVAAPLTASEPEPFDSAQAAPPGEEETPAITLSQVEAALADLEANTRLDDSVKVMLRPKYQQAMEKLREAQRFEAKSQEYRRAIQSAPDRLPRLRDELRVLSSTDATEDLPKTADPERLQEELDTLQQQLDDLRNESLETKREVREIHHRPFEISAELPKIGRRLREIDERLSPPELGPGVASPGLLADRILLQSQWSRLLSERDMLEREQASLSPRQELLDVQQELLRQKAEIVAVARETIDNLLQERLIEQAKETLSRVESLAEGMPDWDPTAQQLAVEIGDLAQELEYVLSNRQHVKIAQDEILALLESFEDDYAALEEQRDLRGAEASTMRRLQRLQLRAMRAHIDVRTTKLPVLDEIQFASILVREKLSGQFQVEQELADSPSEAVDQLVGIRRDLLERLQRQYARQLREFARLAQLKQTYLDRTEEVRNEISAQLLGFEIRSCHPLHFGSLAEIPQGVAWVFRGDHWSAFGSALVNTVSDRPMSSLGWLLVVAGLLAGRRWIREALVQCGTDVGTISKDRFSNTLRAIVWTTLLAAPLPVLIGFAYWVTLHAPETSDWMVGLTNGLWRATYIASCAAVTLAVCQAGGLAAVHFRWSDRVLISLRKSVRRLMIVYLPAIVLTFICLVGESVEYFDSVGMFSILLAHLWAIFVLWPQLRRSERSPENTVRRRPGRHLTVRRVASAALLISLIALSVVACLGYLMTAIQLSQGLVWTAARIFGGVLLYYLALRWFTIRQRRLMLAEALEKRRARLEDAEQGEQEDQSSEIVSVDSADEQGMDLEVISDQLRNLLRLLFSLAVAVVVILFWTRIYPLVEVLDSIPVPLGESVTLLGLLQATLIVVITILLVRMLPGLLELTFLRTTAIDSGTRNAIYTLGQYAVIAVGCVTFVHAVNLDWAKLGWILAGLSVGLGFGLQEVVANFVCGLILLFERPIRVGDVVTMDGTTGTVTRINIRATTITNWDRQDLVVPNKNLITGTILNWTLTASVNRILISVGVAYGSDTERAQQILLDVANDHPQILEDPAPMTSFEKFGDSSLELVLRAYLPDLDHRIRTITELHSEISRRFAEAGIEIAFPQHDVHLRNGDGILTAASPPVDARSRASE
jgi:potassium efflux system protein